jgi:2,3-bisphosphoglycerate-independent phosphoglycerate mutase
LKLKAILVVCDGMADRPVKELKWRTPLEAALKPALNEIAKSGICGIMDIIAPGIPPGSDTATLALLGYDPMKVYSGRGALEAIGSGMKVSPSDIALRCNFATVDEKLVVLDRRAGRIANEDATKLANSLQKVRPSKPSVEFLFKNTIQHRAVLAIRGPKLSAAVSDSDPERVGEKALDIKSLDNSPEAKSTAEILNELLYRFREVLEQHPVNKERMRRKLLPTNIILCRGAGTIPKIKPLSELYSVSAACIAATPLVKGVCKSAGMKLIHVDGATGTPKTDFMAKAKSAVSALEVSDLVFLHVKATDVASHDGNARLKVESIEKISKMVDYLLNNANRDMTYLAVTTDHTTSLATGNHEGDPVPIAITGPFVRKDSVKEFDERACARGGLNRIRGMDLMPILMNFLGKTRKFGA